MAELKIYASPKAETNKEPVAEKKPNHPVPKAIPLGLSVIVVSDGLASSVVLELNKRECAASFILHGKGTSSNDFYDVLGVGDDKKQVIFSLVQLSKWKSLRDELAPRFKTSRLAKGIAFVIPLTTLAGLSVYKFMSNMRPNAQPQEEIIMPEKNNYEAIFAIVNDGFTDLVMSAAKKAGARGGTILSARGTGNKEIEKFYGIVITPEKQIVMILVPKHIRDDVLTSINQAVGFATKGQGIAFALPVGDVVGLAEENDPTEETSK